MSKIIEQSYKTKKNYVILPLTSGVPDSLVDLYVDLVPSVSLKEFSEKLNFDTDSIEQVLVKRIKCFVGSIPIYIGLRDTIDRKDNTTDKAILTLNRSKDEYIGDDAIMLPEDGVGATPNSFYDFYNRSLIAHDINYSFSGCKIPNRITIPISEILDLRIGGIDGAGGIDNNILIPCYVEVILDFYLSDSLKTETIKDSE